VDAADVFSQSERILQERKHGTNAAELQDLCAATHVAATFFRIYASADTQQRDKGNASRARSPDPIQGQATDHSARRIGSRSAAWRCGRDLRGAVRGVERGVARRGEARGLCPSTRPGPCGSSTGFPSQGLAPKRWHPLYHRSSRSGCGVSGGGGATRTAEWVRSHAGALDVAPGPGPCPDGFYRAGSGR
jgi:hypothetical protein